MPNYKQEFIKDVLKDEGKRLLYNQGVAMEKRLNFHTRRVFTDRTASVNVADGMDAMLSITHTAVERFLDIKRRSRSRRTNRVSTKSFKIHNRFVFGHFYAIANRLMFEYTDETRDQIISSFKSLSNG